MKGSLKVEGVKSAEYQQGTKDGGEWPPRFWKIQFEMDDGTRMAFNDARRFARVRFLKDPTSVPPISELGEWHPDVMRLLPQPLTWCLRGDQGTRTLCSTLAHVPSAIWRNFQGPCCREA